MTAGEWLSDAALQRFARQVILPELGEEGQLQLGRAHVAIIGAGGLGAPLVLYLAATGIGRLTIIDDDLIELSNLNRQITHRSRDLGTAKSVSAGHAATALNPDLQLTTLETRLGPDNAAALLADADIIADCTDTAAMRYCISDTAHQLGKPVIFGGAVRLEGQLTTLRSGVDPESPCFRCLFPQAADASLAPRCSEVGILGPVTGIIGSMMALEVVREALRPAMPLGRGLSGRLLLYDGREPMLTEIAVARRPDCPCCGTPGKGRQNT